jgi:hypothetical protein
MPVIQKCPTYIPYPDLMWRQTLRCVSYRSTAVKSNYGNQPIIQAQNQQHTHSPFDNRDRLAEIIFDNLTEQKNQPKVSSSTKNTYDPKDIKLVSPNIQHYLFPNVPTDDSKASEVSNDVLSNIVLPELHKSVEEKGLMAHFDELGKEQFESYEELLEIAANIKEAPKMPQKWSFSAGWTKYDTVNGTQESVDYPNEKVLFCN